MFCRYDSGVVLREDLLERVREVYKEIAKLQKDIERQKQKAVAAMERLERTKKWLGIID